MGGYISLGKLYKDLTNGAFGLVGYSFSLLSIFNGLSTLTNKVSLSQLSMIFLSAMKV